MIEGKAHDEKVTLLGAKFAMLNLCLHEEACAPSKLTISSLVFLGKFSLKYIPAGFLSGRASVRAAIRIPSGREGIQLGSSPILSRLRHSPSQLCYQNKSTRERNPTSYAGYVSPFTAVAVSQ